MKSFKLMTRRRKKRSSKSGLPPGSMIHIGEQRAEKVGIDLIDYDTDNFKSVSLENIKDAYPFRDSKTVSWINISGLHDIDIIQDLGNHFGIHPLILEDILNTDQRPKIEVYDNYLYVVLKMISFNPVSMKMEIEQVSLILGNNFVITFQEYAGDIFDPLRERIKLGKGRIRKNGSDYLLYAILDIVIDEYFLVLENLGDHIELLENLVIENPEKTIVSQIHKLKNELLMFRRNVWPLREVTNSLIREELPFVDESINPFLRDLFDHTVHVADSIDTYRDMTGGLLDVYLSNVSNRMNEVMKVLTIISTIFIPLSFLAGVYGMNFQVMPELRWPWAYFALWGFSAGGMLYYFRRKKWL